MTDTRPVKPIGTLDTQIARFTAHGWQITSRTPDSVQLLKRKQWDVLLLAVGTVGLVFGFGLVYLLAAVLDRLLGSDRVVYLTAAQVQAGQVPNPHVGNNWLLFGLATAFTVVTGGLVLLVLVG